MRAWLLVVLLTPLTGCGSPERPVVSRLPTPVAPLAVVPPVHRTVASNARPELEAALAFEGSAPGAPPLRWTPTPESTVAVDTMTVHGGHAAIRIQRTKTSPDEFSTISDRIPIDFSGSTVELRGFLRTENVSGDTGLWLREVRDGDSVQFTNMQSTRLHGTTGWTEYSIHLPLDATATQLSWGVLLAGEGKAWADDLELLVDGKPVWEAPYVEPPTTALDRDHQFDHGSGIAVAQLSPAQIDHLTLLGKVWGFLKYHHPKVTGGELHWDFELLRTLPEILAATDRAATEAALVRWVDRLGPIAPCQPCATLDGSDLALRPDLGWLDDRAVVGPELSARLHAVYDARVPNRQFYVSLAKGIGNPVFLHEPAYANVSMPDAGFQLLALFRLWNLVEYWAPDRELADGWHDALVELVPRVMLANTPKDYQLEMMSAIARLHDGHANLWSALDVRPPVGACALPIAVRFVGTRPVVVTADPHHDLEAGDVITSLDRTPVDELLGRWKPYYAASNDASRLRDVAQSMTRGPCGEAALVVDRRGKTVQLTLSRTAPRPTTLARDLPGPTFRLLSPEIAYLKLSSVKASEIAHDVESAVGTKGWIVDLRNYPAEFVVFALGSLLVDKPTPFARFTGADLSNPGAFRWSENISLQPGTPHYGGKVVVLVDEVSMSQAEYTAMALRAAPHTVIVGGATAGADGNVSPFALPGGLKTMISGLGVFYPDKTPTQIIGIVPDVVVAPTIAGLAAGRDEVLEAGIRAILGKGATTAHIQRIMKATRRDE